MNGVYVEPTGRRVAPWNDPIAETIVATRTLGEWQADAFRDAGLAVLPELKPPCVVVPDNLFTSGGALRQLVTGAAGRDAVLVLKQSRHGVGTTPVTPGLSKIDAGWRFPSIRVETGRGEPPVDVVVDPEEAELDFPMPGYLGGGVGEIGIARHPVMELHHWVHVMWAGQAAGGMVGRNIPTWRYVVRGLWAATRAMSFNKWKVLGKFNVIGKGCDIHPTAVVEGSTLGDGVSIGPFCRVALSHIDDGATVMPGAQVDLSVVGKGATVAELTTLRFCVVFPNAFAGQYLMQQCVLGRDCITTGGAFSIDLNFDQEIRVPLDGTLHTTGTKFLGIAFGHRSRVGTGFWMQSGRMVPNDVFIIRDPGAVLSKIPGDAPTDRPLIVDGKTLRWDE